MPKAQKKPWPGYWEPTPRNQVGIPPVNGYLRWAEREVASGRLQRGAPPSVEEGQQRGQKRGADFVDEDSEGEVFHTPKARCMTADEEDDAAVSKLDADESQHASEGPSSQQMDVEERIATMEDKIQSLDETTQKHVGDIGYLRPRAAGLASEGRVVKKRVNILEETVVGINDALSELSDTQRSCVDVNRDMMALYVKLVDAMEQTNKNMEKTVAAQAKDRAIITRLRKELSELKDKGSTTAESTST